MAGPDPVIRFRIMTPDDIPFGMALKAQAGWNQTKADWHRLLSLEPEECFVAELDGQPVGTVATCVFGPVGWIAMLLVDKAQRGQGIGTALVKHAIARLEIRGVCTMRLDATDLGRPIYGRFGFAVDWEVAGYEGIFGSVEKSSATEPYRPADLDSIIQLDAAVTGTPRRKLLTTLLAEHPRQTHVIRDDETLVGYGTIRPGSHAWRIGPCAALDRAAGETLLSSVARHCARRKVYVDIPAANAAAVAWAAPRLTLQRRFFRMARGVPVTERVSGIWASSGPELG